MNLVIKVLFVAALSSVAISSLALLLGLTPGAGALFAIVSGFIVGNLISERIVMPELEKRELAKVKVLPKDNKDN